MCVYIMSIQTACKTNIQNFGQLSFNLQNWKVLHEEYLLGKLFVNTFVNYVFCTFVYKTYTYIKLFFVPFYTFLLNLTKLFNVLTCFLFTNFS